MPITLIEAMACGCIPIGTPVSGLNDVIIDGKNGFIAKDFSDEAYIHAIELAIQNKASISRIDLQQSYKDNSRYTHARPIMWNYSRNEAFVYPMKCVKEGNSSITDHYYKY